MLVFAVLLACLVAYLTIGKMVWDRGMAVVRARALTDQQFFVMAVQDGRSLSMAIPKIATIILWPLVLVAVAAMLFASRRSAEEPSLAA